MANGVTAEFYQYDLENLSDTANAVRASVEENGTFEIVGQTISADYQQYGAKENPFGDTDVAEHACQALEQVGTDQPFFLFVGPLGPHDPYIPPQRFLDLYDPGRRL